MPNIAQSTLENLQELHNQILQHLISDVESVLIKFSPASHRRQQNDRLETAKTLIEQLSKMTKELTDSHNTEASAEDRQAIKDLIRTGKITFSPRVANALETMDLKNPDWTLTQVSVSFWGPHKNNGGGMGIDWSTVSAGCGRCDFYILDGKLECMNQGMSHDFIRTLFAYMLENSVLDDEIRFSTDNT